MMVVYLSINVVVGTSRKSSSANPQPPPLKDTSLYQRDKPHIKQIVNFEHENNHWMCDKYRKKQIDEEVLYCN